jgi:SAM-dependent methyltransferase
MIPASLLDRLTDSIEAGRPWRAALAALTRETDLESAALELRDDSLANWIWLADLNRHERALDVWGGVGSMSAALSRHFAHVYMLDSDRPWIRFASARFRQDRLANVMTLGADVRALPLADDVFDCVVLHNGLARLPNRRQVERTLQWAHRVLRPGGCIYLGAPNPYWHQAVRRRLNPLRGSLGGPPSSRAVVRALRTAGFRHIRSYYVSPSIDRPRNIVPADHRAVSVIFGGWPRRIVVRLGGATVLFPSYLVLATK